jgi:hypothetical protein
VGLPTSTLFLAWTRPAADACWLHQSCMLLQLNSDWECPNYRCSKLWKWRTTDRAIDCIGSVLITQVILFVCLFVCLWKNESTQVILNRERDSSDVRTKNKREWTSPMDSVAGPQIIPLVVCRVSTFRNQQPLPEIWGSFILYFVEIL